MDSYSLILSLYIPVIDIPQLYSEDFVKENYWYQAESYSMNIGVDFMMLWIFN